MNRQNPPPWPVGAKAPTARMVAPPTQGPTRDQGRKRSAWFWVLLVLGLMFALALSNCAGFLASSVLRPEATALQEAQEELEAAQLQLVEAQDGEAQALASAQAAESERSSLEREIEGLRAQVDELGSVRGELETALASLEVLEGERDAARDSVATLETRIAELEADLVDAQAAPTSAPAPAAAPAPAPAPVPLAAPSGGSPVYYANCDAVRAAGKAPLYAGSPGYRAGLDRDNDGVACE